MSDIISDAGLVRTLRARFGIRGDTDIGLESSIIPVANLGDVDGAPWHSKGAGVWGGTLAATAAQVNYLGIRCPLTLPKNYRAVVRGAGFGTQTLGASAFIKLSNSAALDATLGAPTLAAVTGAWDSNPDGDAPVRTPMQSYAFTVATVAAGDGFLVNCGVANDIKYVPTGLVWCLAPGNTLYLQCTAVNIGISATFYWDEYYIG